MSDRVKFYKNKHRNEPENIQRYVPNYVLSGIEPQEMMFSNSGTKVEEATVKTPKTRPVVLNPSKRTNQPYAEAVNSPINTRDSVPNVGNNMEHTWSSLDGEIVDDLSSQVVPGHHKMIDNNEFVSDQALGQGPSFGGTQRNRPFPIPSFQSEEVIDDRPTLTDIPVFTDTRDLLPVLKDLGDDQYLLLVKGEPICSGPHKEIEEAVEALIFGNHALNDGSPVPEEDILVVKKVKVNVGVFLG